MSKAKRFLCLLLCALLLCGSILQVNAQEESITLRIISKEGFLNFAENCRLDSYSRDLTVLLCSDIDLTDVDFSGIPSFSGTFEGNGHTISGLNICADGSNAGLFRYLTDTAVVQNLQIRGTAAPGGSGNAVGSLAGKNEGTIENCHFEGTVSGNDSVGGLVGINQISGIITACTASGTVNGNHFIGGIAGDNYGVIRNSENHAQINTTVEQNDVELEDITLDSIVNSESVSTVTDIGGICGTGTGVIRDCINHGSVGYHKIGYNIGGIAGSFSGYVYNCINRGIIDGRKEVGGIVGQLKPAVNMIYEEDTLQTLQQQMNDLSDMTGGAGAHIQSGTNALNDQTQRMEQQLEDAQDALSILIPDAENPELPDEETLQAARNALSSSLSDITASFNSMASISQNTLGALYGDIQGISSQMNAISGTIGNASENLGGGIKDISDNDTAADLTAKIRSCTNLGSIQGDWNIGGITGAIALENDLDPESDLQIIGNTSLNFDMELRAVVLDCDNKGPVLGTKQNVGGIAGWVSLGLVKQCINAASVDAAAADYAGGIAGQSSGYIRGCSAKCTLSGDTYVGGIAGLGTTVTDCRTIVLLSGATEKSGAILGSMDEATLEANYYLVLDSDPGAVDGISYDTLAQPLPSDGFFALADLPGSFRQVAVTFVFDDPTSRRISLPYGSVLAPELIPAVPENANSDAVWVGPITVGSNVYYDMTFHLEYTSHLNTLESDIKNSAGLPVLLAQGEFMHDAALTAAILEEPGAVAAWTVTLPESTAAMKLRCLLPQDCDADYLRLIVNDGTGWTEASFTTDGSYLVFPVSGQIEALRLEEIPKDYTVHIIGGAALIVMAAVITAIAIGKRKKKTKA